MVNDIRKMIDKINHFNQYVNEGVINQSYYRIITKFESDSIVFTPKGYYEATDNDGNPIMATGDIWSRSTTPEIAASKTVGGAILGLWSMGRSQGTSIKNGYLYEINEKPQKDLSHLRIDDFEWLKEVRYTNPVKGVYVGEFVYTEEFNKLATNFYERLTQDPSEEGGVDDDAWDIFEKYIITVNKNDLK
jgi:hypothetical protein